MSSRTLRIVLVALTVLGVALASYLTYVHYAEIKPLCTAGNACIKVQSSVYSKLAGVPVALMGLIGYVAILGSLLVRQSETSRLATMSLTLVGFGFSAYLTYRELFSIHAVCEECATSAGILTVLMCLSVWQFLRGDIDPTAARATPAVQSAGAEPAAPLSSAS
ncbi:MAG: vitamin K epoxide reductase family protein [Solirubrobacteraceae bacterium]